MKRGVFIYSNFNFAVKNTAGVSRMLNYAKAIANDDTAVYLATCSSSPITIDSFKAIYPNVYLLKDNTITNSFLGTFRFVKNLFRFSQESVPEKSFLFYPSPLLYLEVFAIIYLKFIKKCSVFYELNEIRKYTATFSAGLSIKRPKYSVKKVIYKSVFSTLEYLLPHYDGLICISTAIESYGQRFNPTTTRIPILTNPNKKIELSSNVYAQKDVFNIGFSGSIDPVKENLLDFFEVLGKLQNDNFSFRFNLCGQIKKKDEVFLFEQIANKLNISGHIKYYGLLNARELSTFLSQQHLLVIPRGFTLQNNYGFSTKLADYLDHGKPILVTDVSDNKLFIEDGINGFIVPADNNENMFDKLKYIINNYDGIYENIQKNAIKTSKNSFYYRNFHEKLTKFLFK